MRFLKNYIGDRMTVVKCCDLTVLFQLSIPAYVQSTSKRCFYCFVQ